jgi:uncharacterized membrane protein YfcA
MIEARAWSWGAPVSVPFCRAANGTLAGRARRVSLFAMAILRVVSGWVARFRAQRWSREILLAIVLTLAAAAFIGAALMGHEPHGEAKPPFAAADK